jgi:hypothetical protein
MSPGIVANLSRGGIMDIKFNLLGKEEMEERRKVRNEANELAKQLQGFAKKAPYRWAGPLCVNNSETSSPSTISVGAEKDSHLHEQDQW